MFMISASQIRAARGLLNWTQDELADASKISRSTVQNVENDVTVRTALIKSIWSTLKEHGIEFLPNNGVCRKAEGLRDFTGSQSCDLFFEDVMKTIRSKGGNFVCSIHTEAMLMRKSGFGSRSNLQRFEEVLKLTEVKCLIPGQEKWELPKTPFSIRELVEDRPLFSASYFSYGDRLVFGYLDATMQCVFALFENKRFARDAQSYFLARWNKAKLLGRECA
jgi:transcriptional regulator with XRE-family HTH domain